MRKFKAGQKVKLPTTKNAGWGSLESSVVRDAKYKGQDYLYVTGYEENATVVLSPYYNGHIEGDFFLESEVEAYGIPAPAPRKFKTGDKVKMPIRKSGGVSTLEDVLTRYEGKKYLYVKAYDGMADEYYVSDNMEEGCWDFIFKEEDLEPYVPHKYKQGDKVCIPTRKTAGLTSFGNSVLIHEAKEAGVEYLTVHHVFEREDECVLGAETLRATEIFHFDDLEPYVSTKKQRVFKRGDRVQIPKTKSAGNIPITHSEIIQSAKRKGMDYLHVVAVAGNGDIALSTKETHSLGEWYRPEDLEIHEGAQSNREKRDKLREKHVEMKKLLCEIEKLMEEM